jgi:hypothetical protein
MVLFKVGDPTESLFLQNLRTMGPLAMQFVVPPDTVPGTTIQVQIPTGQIIPWHVPLQWDKIPTKYWKVTLRLPQPGSDPEVWAQEIRLWHENREQEIKGPTERRFPYHADLLRQLENNRMNFVYRNSSHRKLTKGVYRAAALLMEKSSSQPDVQFDPELQFEFRIFASTNLNEVFTQSLSPLQAMAQQGENDQKDANSSYDWSTTLDVFSGDAPEATGEGVEDAEEDDEEPFIHKESSGEGNTCDIGTCVDVFFLGLCHEVKTFQFFETIKVDHGKSYILIQSPDASTYVNSVVEPTYEKKGQHTAMQTCPFCCIAGVREIWAQTEANLSSDDQGRRPG